MKRSTRNVFLKLFFQIKSLLSLALATLGFFILFTKVKQAHIEAVADLAQQTKPTTIDPNLEICQGGPNAKFQPPDKVLLGFSIDWKLHTPKTTKKMLEFTPAIM